MSGQIKGSKHAARDRVLKAMPGTPQEIAAKAFVSESTARSWIRNLRAEPVQACHIAKWLPNNGRATAVHVAGPGEDAPEPKALSGAQYSQKFRKKAVEQDALAKIEQVQRADSERRRHEALVRRRAQENADRMAATPNTWLAALGASA